MDPMHNPYAPGAGQRPPELAGRDEVLRTFEVVVERVAQARPERSVILTGLRGTGKTVLLNALRGVATERAWGTGKWEARPDHDIRIPVAQAAHAALRELGVRHRHPDRVSDALAVLVAFAQRAPVGHRAGQRWRPPADVGAATGRADSGDIELDLIELFDELGDVAADLGVGVALFVDEMQDVTSDDLAALCGACHEIGQRGRPVLVVGAGLPHLPTALAASKSYAERLFRYLVVDRLSRKDCDRALLVPAASAGAGYEADALRRLYELTDGYPYFVQAYGKVVWDSAVASPISCPDVEHASTIAEAELAVGFFGSRYERATPAERDYMRAMADLIQDGTEPSVSTSDVARALGRRAQSLSPARDGLIKKGLVFAEGRGLVRFTVPHFEHFLLSQRA
jgi:AAA ATPase domain